MVTAMRERNHEAQKKAFQDRLAMDPSKFNTAQARLKACFNLVKAEVAMKVVTSTLGICCARPP